MMESGISFDRAAEFYDETRALAPHVREALTAALLEELHRAGASSLLEVGAGTGRISYPLAANGVRVVGVDVSRAMLLKFQQKIGPEDATPELLLGDAICLPFKSGAFRAALVVHVLHLMHGWKQAIREIRRVLAPGGVVLRQGEDDDFEMYPEHRESDEAWTAILTRRGHVPRERAGIELTNAYVRELGGSVRTVELCEDGYMRSEASFIESMRKRLHSNMWEIPDETYWPAVDEYEAWARERFGDLSIERKVTLRYRLDVWAFP